MPDQSKPSFSLNDEPSLENKFSGAFVDQLCEIIRHSQAPKNIALTGYWGSGKTSTLKQLYYHLTNTLPPGCEEEDKPELKAGNHDDTLVPIWFEAWRYQYEEQPIIALLNEIRTRMGMFSKLLQEGEKLGSVTLRGALGIVDDVIKLASGGTVKPDTGKIQAIGEQWEQNRYLNKLPQEQICKCLEEAIDNVLGKTTTKEKKRLIIFIDDLDRCLPTASLRLLEGIKIYLNLKNCLVVFGMDHRQLEQSLLQALPKVSKTSENTNDTGRASYYAREYLEKICPDIHYIPVPDQQEKFEYFLALLGQLDCGKAQEMKVHHKFLQKIFKECNCLPANPRKIKILVNRTALILRAIKPSNDDAEETWRWYALMLTVVIIYAFHKPVYEQLESNPGYIQEVGLYSDGDSIVRKDVRLVPMQGINPSWDGDKSLPVNPSDANVWRLHELLLFLDSVTKEEITPFLRLQ